MKFLAATLCVLAYVSTTVLAECPNKCSGNGVCDNNEQCTCRARKIITNKEGNEDNVQQLAWTGADCSLSTCPRGTSWTNVPTKPLIFGKSVFCTHVKGAECSDQGKCNRQTGDCQCFPGYTGNACQRTTCPNDCSGHGTCQSNREFAQDATRLLQPYKYNTYALNAEFESLISYKDAWDSGMHYGCKCDSGYRGPDCSLRECPSSDDRVDKEGCKGPSDNDWSNTKSYLEFVGEEYMYANERSIFNQNQYPVPNKILFSNELYIDAVHMHPPKDAKAAQTMTPLQATMDDAAPWSGGGVKAGYAPYNGQCNLRQDVVPDATFGGYPYYKDSAGNVLNLHAQDYTTASSATAAKAVASGYDEDGNIMDADGTVVSLLTRTFQTTTTGQYKDYLGSGSYERKSSLVVESAERYTRCIKGFFCGGRTSGEECSGRGQCDYTKGMCECFPGYTGLACESPTTVG